MGLATGTTTGTGRTWRRVGFWAAGAGGVFVGLFLLLRVGVGIYLGTSAGKATVARELETLIGLPVEVAEVDLGSSKSSVKFRVMDPALAGRPDAEVLAVDSATADVSLTDVLTGRSNPKEVRLRGVRLALRIGADGRILTTLPAPTGGPAGGSAPAVILDDGSVRIRQEGKPEFALSGVHLRLDPDGDRLRLSGEITDPGWGKWQVSGEIDRANKTGWVELATADAPLVTERLRSVPYVPGAIWDHVQPDGRGGAKVRLTYAPDAGVTYDVMIQPRAASLAVPDADVTLTDLTGNIRIHEARVELAGCRAKMAGGVVGANGVVDFGPEPATVAVKVTADKLDVNAVPASWGVPKDFGGRLVGNADIVLGIVADGTINPTGSTGAGRIEGATIRGFPAEIEVHLRPEGQHLKLNQGSPPPGPGTQSRHDPEPDRMPSFGGDAERIAPEPPALRCASPPNDDPILPFLLVLLQQPPKTPPAGGTALDATVTLRDIDLADFLAKMEVKIPTKVGGKVTVVMSLSVPVERAGTVAAYHFQGTITSPALTVEGLTIRDFHARVDFHNGLLELTALRGAIARPDDPSAPLGTFSGTAAAQIDPPGDITASFQFDNLPPGEVLKGVPSWSIEVRGLASGKAEFTAPYQGIDDPTTWKAGGNFTSNELVVAGRSVTGIRFAAAVARGTVTLTDATATVAGIPVVGKGTLGLTDKMAFTAEVRTTPADVADLRKLAPDLELGAVEGLLEVEAKVTGTVAPVAFSAAGTVRATKLKLGGTPANRVEVKWEANQERLSIPTLSADVFGGTVGGSLDLPFGPQKAGKFAVTFDNVDAAAAIALVPDFPVKVTGRVTGMVNGTIGPAKPNEALIGDLDLTLTSDKLTVQGLPATELTGRATIKAGVINFALKGKTLGGEFDIKGRYPGLGKGKPRDGERGTVVIRGINLARIAPTFNDPTLAPLTGRVNLTFEFEPDLSAGSGRVEILGFGWGNTVSARELRGVLVLADGVLVLRELSGEFAGGRVEVRARVPLTNPRRNFIAVELLRVNARELLAPIPVAAGVIDGPVSAVIRGSYDRELRLDGTITLNRGTLGGIAVEELRVPFRLTSGAGGFTQLAIREASTRAGSGRLQAEVTLLWGSTVFVNGQVRFANVPISTVVPSLGSNALVGNGRVTGRFDISGTNVRSADDLTGTLVASLQGASPGEIPLLQRAVQYLSPLGLARPFDTGDVRANLSRGVFRVQRLALVSPSAQVFAEGTVTLAGRVDLAVVAHTGPIGPDVQALRLLGLRLPAIGPIPLSLIADVSAFLSNRTVRLEITGTTTAPVVRVNARALLAEEAVRFFLTRYVLPAEATDVFGTGPLGGSLNRK